MRVFFDSSAFAKWYIRESGTDVVLEWCNRATELCLSGIVLPEVVSALCRVLREQQITAPEYDRLKTALLEDITDAVICDLTPEVIRYAFLALEANVLRGMDAIHLGSALALGVDVFVSADARQCAAAERAGVQVVRV